MNDAMIRPGFYFVNFHKDSNNFICNTARFYRSEEMAVEGILAETNAERHVEGLPPIIPGENGWEVSVSFSPSLYGWVPEPEPKIEFYDPQPETEDDVFDGLRRGWLRNAYIGLEVLEVDRISGAERSALVVKLSSATVATSTNKLFNRLDGTAIDGSPVALFPAKL